MNIDRLSLSLAFFLIASACAQKNSKDFNSGTQVAKVQDAVAASSPIEPVSAREGQFDPSSEGQSDEIIAIPATLPSSSTAGNVGVNPSELTPVSLEDRKVPLNADPLFKLCTDPGPLPVKNAKELFCSQNATTGIPLGKWAMDCNGTLPWRYCQCVEIIPGEADWDNCRNTAPSAIEIKNIYPVK